MTPASRRILAAAAAHRRCRATTRWFSYAAGLSEGAAHAALVALSKTGHVARLEGDVYDVLSTHVDDE